MSLSEYEIRKIIDSKIAELERRINAKIDSAISSAVNSAVSTALKDGAQNERQLALTNTAVRSIMERDYIPKIEAQLTVLSQNTADGDLLVNEYRKRVVGGPNAGPMLTRGNNTRADFRNTNFVFRESD